MEEHLTGQTMDRDPYSPEQLLAAAKTRLAHAEVSLVRAEADGRKGGFFSGLNLTLALRERNEAKRALAREEAFQAKAASERPAHADVGLGQRFVSTVGRPEPDNDLSAWDANLRAHAAELRAERAERRVAILERAASAEFEWEGQVDIGTDLLSPVPVRIRSTEAGIRGVEETIQRLRERVAELEAETTGAFVGADIQPSADGATTYTVFCGDASMTVTGSASSVAALVKLAYGGFEYGVSA